MSVIILTTGVPGSGKSYVRCSKWLVDEFLHDKELTYVSNVAVKPDAIAEYLSPILKCEPNEVSDRIIRIPKEEMYRWMDDGYGPWEYFKDESMDGVHIAIDEFHNFCGPKHSKFHIQKWVEWLSEIRHEGATFEAITQTIKNLPDNISSLADIRINISDESSVRDPAFYIKYGDMWQLKAKVTGKYTPRICETVYKNRDGRFKALSRKFWTRTDKYFQFYDSFQETQQAEKKGSRRKLQWEKYSWPRFMWYFMCENLPFLLASPRTWAIAFGLFFMLGGTNLLISAFQSAILRQKPGIEKKADAESKAKPGCKTCGIKEDSKPEINEHTARNPQEMGYRNWNHFKSSFINFRDKAQEVFAQRDRYEVRQKNMLKIIKESAELINSYEELIKRQSQIVGYSDGMIAIGNTWHREGDYINEGEFKGHQIAAIDYNSNFALLDDGSYLFICNDNQYLMQGDELARRTSRYRQTQQASQQNNWYGPAAPEPSPNDALPIPTLPETGTANAATSRPSEETSDNRSEQVAPSPFSRFSSRTGINQRRQ